ncbi:HNH endonuclease [Streptomyces sp. SID7499]|uniref:HNH endonuclease n=1 Tax=Streptomyces sp. SID7499 TaxID=2706086 RepID=A0A6G3WN79_9ACTN|nr:HNH endonuclease [Streptomyces sp. SID7499]
MKTLADRFWCKVQRNPDGCWLWTAATFKATGYGQFREGGRGSRVRTAHRVAYELLVGSVPAGLQLDHLCRNRRCVNPAHLEPVTNRENGLRGTSFAAVNAAKTHCVRGHAFDTDNTLTSPATGHRRCRACARERQLTLRTRKDRTS